MRPYNTRGASKLHVFSPRHQQQVEQSQPMRSERWTEVEKFMLLLIAQEHNELTRLVDGNPTSLVWTEMTTIFNRRMNLNRTTQQLKGAWNKLKHDFYRYYGLSSKSGWGCNYDLNIHDTSDEFWDEFIEANPIYKSMQSKSFSIYGMLQRLTRNTFVAGNHVRRSSYPDIMTNSPSPQVNVKKAQEEDTFADRYVFTQESRGNVKALTPTSSTRSIKRSYSDELTLSQDTTTASRRRRIGKEVQSDLRENIARCESYMQKKLEESEPYSYETAINKLNTLDNLSSGGYNALTLIFQGNPDMRTTFMLLPGCRLRGWVEYVINLEKKWDGLPLWAD